MRTFTLLFIGPLLAHAAEPLRVPWSLVPATCSDRTAIVTLTTGTRIEGRLLNVTETTFEMEVRRTSSKQEVPKGYQRLDRSAFSELRVREKRIAGRVIGTIAGVLLAGPAVYQLSAGAAQVIGLPLYVGIVAFGHFAGREVDRRTQQVIVIPESPAP